MGESFEVFGINLPSMTAIYLSIWSEASVILWFSLLKCEDMLLLSVVSHCKQCV